MKGKANGNGIYVMANSRRVDVANNIIEGAGAESSWNRFKAVSMETDNMTSASSASTLNRTTQR